MKLLLLVHIRGATLPVVESLATSALRFPVISACWGVCVFLVKRYLLRIISFEKVHLSIWASSILKVDQIRGSVDIVSILLD